MKKLVYYGGEGFSYARPTGIYEVISGEEPFEVKKVFTKLQEAVSYFEALKCEKAIWDRRTHDLLECWVYAPPKEECPFKY